MVDHGEMVASFIFCASSSFFWSLLGRSPATTAPRRILAVGEPAALAVSHRELREELGRCPLCLGVIVREDREDEGLRLFLPLPRLDGNAVLTLDDDSVPLVGNCSLTELELESAG